MPKGEHMLVRSKELEDRVIELYSEGKTVTEIAAIIGVKVHTIQRWKLDDPIFYSNCTRAQDTGYEIDADSLKTIADVEPDVNKARLKSDNLKWLLARRAPSRYGDKLDINVTGAVSLTAALDEAKRRMLPSTDQDTIVTTEYREVTKEESDDATGSIPNAEPQDLTSTDIFE